MPPKQNSSFSRTLSNSSISSSSNGKGKLKQNKLDFSFHSTTDARPPLGSRPLSSTPSFGLPTTAPTAPVTDKGKHKEQQQQSHVSTRAAKSKAESPNADEDQDESWLWAEKLAPGTSDELAVHPKKVAQVRSWLVEAFSSRSATVKYSKVLALTGPAGAGKSSTIRALAAPTELDFDILEWQNDQPSFDASNPGPSFIERFTDFLSKAAKFPTLDLQASSPHSECGVASSSLFTLDDNISSTKRNRVILLEDLPNLHHLPTKQLFQAAIEQYIQQSTLLTSRGFANVPIVLVLTESTPREDQDRWVGDSSTSNWKERIASIIDTRTALGQGIRKNQAYAEVRFNPVAPTIIMKGLKRAMEKAGHTMAKAASKGVLMELLQAVADDSNGDLRAAVNCLQFVGVDGGLMDAISTKGRKSGRKGTEEERRKAMRKLMPLVSGRESSLALFHALGRVLYNKREGDPNDEGPTQKRTISFEDTADSDDSDTDQPTIQLNRRINAAIRSFIPPSSSSSSTTAADTQEQLPDHISHLFRRQSLVSVDQLWADLPVDSSVFQLYLHTNFPQFCGEIEECEGILEAFSAADALMPMHEQYLHSGVVNYYSFLVSVRGTLLGLPSPVERKGQKLGKAAWWDVQKKLRGLMGDVEDVKAAYTPGLKVWSAAAEGAGAAGEGRLKRVKFNNPSLAAVVGGDDAGRSEVSVEIGAGSVVARSNTVTLLTEILPLLAKIQGKGRDDKVHELVRMRFEYAGIADIASRQLDEHETGVLDNEEDADVSEEQGRKRKAIDLQQQLEEEEKLILSDDDIGDF